MQAKEVAKIALSSTQFLTQTYLADLSDADLLVRPVPNANTIAWQLSHLIHSEKHLLAEMLPGVKFPDLPPSITSLGSDKTGKAAPTGGYLTKAEYLDWFTKVRAATIAAVEKLSDADLDKPNSGPMAQFAPNLAAMLILIGNHTLMHAGQFTVIRRALNKPVLF
jgi:uncharacterized damage-inducible protein DinB